MTRDERDHHAADERYDLWMDRYMNGPRPGEVVQDASAVVLFAARHAADANARALGVR